MNPIAFAKRRPVASLTLVIGMVGGGIVAKHEMGAVVDPAQKAPQFASYLDYIGARFKQAQQYVASRFAPHSSAESEKSHDVAQKIVVTSPKVEDVVIPQPYVCQIHAMRHIEVCAISGGYLQSILVKEGHLVKKGDLLFKILPVLYQAKFDAESAEAHLAELKYHYTQALSQRRVVSENQVALEQAEFAKAQAKATLAGAELNFTNITAAYDGIVDKLMQREGSLINEGDVLTTISDNSVMWVYFNVPEAQYLDYMAHEDLLREDDIELVLANGKKFTYTGKIGAIEAKFNNQTGNIPFRADFQNPARLLRHGQTGTVILHRTEKDAIVIPQRATFDLLDKRYVYVVDKDGVAHQRLVTVKDVLEDIFVIDKGLEPGEKFVFEGIREVHDGQKVEFEFVEPDEVLAHQKKHAE